MVVFIHNKQFVDANIVGKKPVSSCNRVIPEFVFANG